MAANVKVDGIWLETIGGVGDLKWSSAADGGSEEASWTMQLPDTFSNPVLTAGKVVEIKVGAKNVWKGVLSDPERDKNNWSFTAIGMYDELHGYLCLDSGGDTTSTPDVAVDQAIARGLQCTRPTSLSNSPFAEDDDTDALNYVGDLLDAWSVSVSKRWLVDPDGRILAVTDPTTPKWYLSPGTVRLALADDDYASDLYLRYLSGPLTFATVHVSDPTASSTRRREFYVDAFDLGVTTNTNVTNIGNGLLARGAARYSWTAPADVSQYQITTPGGQPACLPFVKAGDMFRALGVVNQQGVPLPYYDFIAGRVEYEDGSGTITVSPTNLATRTLGDFLAVD